MSCFTLHNFPLSCSFVVCSCLCSSQGRRDRAESRSSGRGQAFQRFCWPHGRLANGGGSSLAGKATERGDGVFEAGERERCWGEEKNGHQAQEETMRRSVLECWTVGCYFICNTNALKWKPRFFFLFFFFVLFWHAFRVRVIIRKTPFFPLLIFLVISGF